MKVKTVLTPEHVRELLDYDPETGFLTWRIERPRGVKVGSRAGSLDSEGYRIVTVDGWPRKSHQLIWLHVHGFKPEQPIDHINGEKDDNRLSNLRLCSTAENRRNSATMRVRKAKSKWKGVTIKDGKWTARICSDGRRYELGSFSDEREAAEAYMFAALELHGEFARLE